MGGFESWLEKDNRSDDNKAGYALAATKHTFPSYRMSDIVQIERFLQNKEKRTISKTDNTSTIDNHRSTAIASRAMIFILLGAGAPTHRTNAMEPPSASSVTEPSVIHQVRSTLIGYSTNPTSIAVLGYDGHVDAAGTPIWSIRGGQIEQPLAKVSPHLSYHGQCLL